MQLQNTFRMSKDELDQINNILTENVEQHLKVVLNWKFPHQYISYNMILLFMVFKKFDFSTTTIYRYITKGLNLIFSIKCKHIILTQTIEKFERLSSRSLTKSQFTD